MGFDPEAWRVRNLFVVPGHFITPTVVKEHNPLSSDAPRSGWVGSNILLNRIPEANRNEVVENGRATTRSTVRNKFAQTAFLSRRDVSTRDWTTAVLDCIDNLDLRPGDRFAIANVYDFEDRLAELYPENNHVRAKIRQQLQVLRDEGLIEFLGDGEYRLRWVDDR